LPLRPSSLRSGDRSCPSNVLQLLDLQQARDLFAFVTPDRFRLTSGEGAQTVYHFNKGLIDHMFCPTCGIASFSAGKAPSGRAMVAVNVRCLDDIDLSQIAYGQFDEKSL
jgi:hypothetical protein